MIISNCPRCHEGFRVPASSLPDDSYGRCPWCHETFPITDVLYRLPPQLEILAADGRPLEIERASAKVGTGLELIDSSRPFSAAHSVQPSGYETEADFEVDDELVDRADEKTVRGAITDTIVDDDWQQRQTGFDTEHEPTEIPIHTTEDPHSTFDGSMPSPLHSMTVSNKGTVRNRRKGSGIGTLVGIVLGGLASVPIAGFLLMMLGKTPDWGFWPFDGRSQGTTSVRAATPLLPQESDRETAAPAGTQLRFNRETSSAATMEDPARSAAAQITGDAISGDAISGDAITGDAITGDAITGDAITGDSNRGDLTSGSQASGISLVKPATDDDGEESLRLEPTIDPTAAVRVAVSTTTPSSDSQNPTPLTSNEPNATAQLRTLSQSEIEALMFKASQQLDKMLLYEGPEAERNRRLSVTYQTIASAASSLAPPGESLKSLATKIVASPYREELKHAGWNWLQLPSRELDGVALIGRTNTNDQGSFLSSEEADTIALDFDQPILDDQETLVLGVLTEQGKRLHVVHVEPIP
jgi:hypothetical protein